MSKAYKEVEWLGGPFDGTKVNVKKDLTSILYPQHTDVLQTGKASVSTHTVEIPIRKGLDGKEYLMWFQQRDV